MEDSVLENWRKRIDELDDQLLEIISQRMQMSRKIGKHKKENNLPFLDTKRRSKVINKNLSKADLLLLPKIFVKELFTLIHNYSLEIQK